MNWVAFTVFVALFDFVTVIGFIASHWRRGDLDLIDEWGLAGRRGGLTIPCYAALVINPAAAVVFIIHATRGRDETVNLDYQEAAA